MAGNADAAAHDDAVGERDHRLGIARDQPVHPVFGGKEASASSDRARQHVAPAPPARRRRSRSPCAPRPRTAPRRRRRSSRQASSAAVMPSIISRRQRVDRFGPVERDDAQPAFALIECRQLCALIASLAVTLPIP